MCSCCARGLSYMHSQRKIHRDIKVTCSSRAPPPPLQSLPRMQCANIMVTADGDVKLADFGVSARLTHTMAKVWYWKSVIVIVVCLTRRRSTTRSSARRSGWRRRSSCRCCTRAGVATCHASRVACIGAAASPPSHVTRGDRTTTTDVLTFGLSASGPPPPPPHRTPAHLTRIPQRNRDGGAAAASHGVIVSPRSLPCHARNVCV